MCRPWATFKGKFPIQERLLVHMTRWSEAKASVDMSRNSQDINLQLPMRVSCVMPPLLCGEVRAEVAKPSIDPSLPL